MNNISAAPDRSHRHGGVCYHSCRRPRSLPLLAGERKSLQSDLSFDRHLSLPHGTINYSSAGHGGTVASTSCVLPEKIRHIPSPTKSFGLPGDSFHSIFVVRTNEKSSSCEQQYVSKDSESSPKLRALSHPATCCCIVDENCLFGPKHHQF